MESGLIDRVGFRDEAYARVAELVGAKGISPDSGDADGDDGPSRLYLSRYARATGPGGPARPSIPGRGRKSTVAVVQWIMVAPLTALAFGQAMTTDVRLGAPKATG